MRARLITGVLVLGALTLVSAQTSQPRPAAPTSRNDANFIRIDMFATDRGQPVEDLTAADIDVLEDGVRQTVATFEHVAIGPGSPAASAPDQAGASSGSSGVTGTARARVFVVFVDTFHTQLEGSSPSRQPLVQFLDRLIGADDLVAAVTSDVAGADVALGRKADVISHIAQSEWDWARPGISRAATDPKNALYDSCYPDSGDTAGVSEEMKNRRREMLTLDALDNLVRRLDGLREERKAVITVTEGWLLGGPSQKLARLAPADRKPAVQTPFGIGRRDRPNRGSAGGVSTTECDADREALAAVDYRQRFRDLTDRANRANVTFYPVSPRGLVVSDTAVPASDESTPPSRDAKALGTRQDSLKQLALETDGTAVLGAGDLDRGLTRIGNDVSSYYLVGYYSTNQKLDGRFRTVIVRTKRSGLLVRTRRGYRASTPEDLTGVPAPAPLSTRASNSTGALAPAAAPSKLRLRAAAWPRQAADGVAGPVWVVGELDYKLRRDVAWTAGAAADVLLVSSSGKEVLSQTLDIDPAEGTFSVQMPQTGNLPAGEYALRISVHSRQGVASLTETSRVIVPARAKAIGDAVMWRRGPSTGPRFLMTADPRFQRSDRVRLELASDTAGMPTAHLLDQVGKPIPVPVSVSDRADQSGGFRWIVAELSLAPLAPGSYGIEVGANGEKVVTTITVVP